jgi:hypothetical protein
LASALASRASPRSVLKATIRAGFEYWPYSRCRIRVARLVSSSLDPAKQAAEIIEHEIDVEVFAGWYNR